MTKAKVKWFNDAKGFGFLEVEGLDTDVFVHYQAIQSDGPKSLTKNEIVDIEYETEIHGPEATKVIRNVR